MDATVARKGFNLLNFHITTHPSGKRYEKRYEKNSQKIRKIELSLPRTARLVLLLEVGFHPSRELAEGF